MTEARIVPGSKVTFTNHINGLVHTVVTRDGDDVTLQDPRGRLLHRTPIELLVLVEPGGDKPWRGVDELEAF